MSEKFNFKWNDFHSNVSKSFSLLRNEEYFHDVTLVGDDNRQISAHKLVLSTSSEYFTDIFKNNKHSHPLLCFDGIKNHDLSNILDFIYRGEVQIYQENLYQFLAIAQRFKLKGLLDNQESVSNGNDNYHKDKIIPEDHEVETETTAVNDGGIIMKKNTHYNVFFQKREDYNVDKTVELALDVEGLNEIDEKILEYTETCSDGSFKCKVCGKVSDESLKQASQKQNLRNHIETHMEGISYACPICKKLFRSRNSLNCHKSKYHKKPLNWHNSYIL